MGVMLKHFVLGVLSTAIFFYSTSFISSLFFESNYIPPSVAIEHEIISPKMVAFFKDQTEGELPGIKEMFGECFPGSDRTAAYMKRYRKQADLFFLLHPITNQTIGYIEWFLRVYEDSSDKKAYRALEMYGVCIHKDFRGRGYEIPLVLKSMALEKEHYQLADSTIVGLHLNENDKCMPAAFNLYVKLGFNHHVELCVSGPPDIARRSHILFDDEKRRPLHRALQEMPQLVKKAKEERGNHPLFLCMFRLLGDQNIKTGVYLQNLLKESKTSKKQGQ